MDEERHAKEEEEVHDGEVEDEDISYCLLRPALGLFGDGVNNDAVPHDTKETYDSKYTWQDNCDVIKTSIGWKTKELC